MNKYIIGFGLSGGFGGAQNFEVIDAFNIEEAEREAYTLAVQEYESHEGRGGLQTLQEIMEEEGLDEEEATLLYNDEIDSWIDIVVYEYTDEKADEIESIYGLDRR